jgi:hypothetical protein
MESGAAGVASEASVSFEHESCHGTGILYVRTTDGRTLVGKSLYSLPSSGSNSTDLTGVLFSISKESTKVPHDKMQEIDWVPMAVFVE